MLYGDPADIEVLDHAEVDYAKLLVVAIPDRHTQEMVIANAQTLNKNITIFAGRIMGRSDQAENIACNSYHSARV